MVLILKIINQSEKSFLFCEFFSEILTFFYFLLCFPLGGMKLTLENIPSYHVPSSSIAPFLKGSYVPEDKVLIPWQMCAKFRKNASTHFIRSLPPAISCSIFLINPEIWFYSYRYQCMPNFDRYNNYIWHSVYLFFTQFFLCWELLLKNRYLIGVVTAGYIFVVLQNFF